MIRWCLIFLALSFCFGATAQNSCDVVNDYEPYVWSGLFYSGITAKQTFGQLFEGHYTSAGESIYTAELAYTLDRNSQLRKFFIFLVDTMQVAGNATVRREAQDTGNIMEGNLYLIWRWTGFPWDRYFKNTFAIGDGISYASHVPQVDKLTADDGRFRRLLNYLMVEVTFAVPSKPEIQFVGRLHHRCTAFGLYGENNAGSTSVGIGLRYYFTTNQS